MQFGKNPLDDKPDKPRYVREKHFMSLYSFIESAKSRSHCPSLNLHNLSSRDAGNKQWYGTKSFEDYVAIVNKGWDEGMEQIKKLTKDYQNIFNKFFPTQDYKQETQYGHHGEAIDINKFLANEPEHMMHFVQNEEDEENLLRGAKLQRMIVNCCCNSYIEAKTIYTRNALISALINSMELYGFRVEVNAVFNYRGNNGYGGGNTYSYQKFYVKAKAFDDDMNINKLALILAHPSTQRRAVFSLMEEEGNNNKENKIICDEFILASYGRAIDITEEEIINFGTDPGSMSQRINSSNFYFEMLKNNYTLEQMVEQCNQKLIKQFNLVSFNKPSDEEKEKE
jgi:hypothetical protein